MKKSISYACISNKLDIEIKRFIKVLYLWQKRQYYTRKTKPSISGEGKTGQIHVQF